MSLFRDGKMKPIQIFKLDFRLLPEPSEFVKIFNIEIVVNNRKF